MQSVTPNITLSTGRTITHSRMTNGAQFAEPTTGPNEMTNTEWEEYCAILRGEQVTA